MLSISRRGKVMFVLTALVILLTISILQNRNNTIVQIDGNVTDALQLSRLSNKLSFANDQISLKDSTIQKLQEKVSELETRQHQQRFANGAANGSGKTTQDHPAADLGFEYVIPDLFNLMPHLNGDSKALKPHRTEGKAKTGVEMVLAVPHVHRPVADYLMSTLESLFKGMNAKQKEETVIIIMVAEPFNETEFDVVVNRVSPRFRAEMDSGNLQLILPPAAWYPDLDHLPEKWGDKPDRAKWRTKQNLDYAFMMLYCHHIGKLYVQLEDDISAKDNYIETMKNFASSNDRWELLEFSQLGFIGKMFRSSMLPKFVSFVLMFYKHKPVDWLLDNYFWVQECFGKSCSDLSKIRKRFRPSLFQHEGYHSSLAGKVQKLKDKDYNRKTGGNQVNDPIIFAHVNPPADLKTSLKQYQKYSLEDCYNGKSVFWALNPQPNDHVTIIFKNPVTIDSYRIVSGDRQHKDDRLMNATLEVLPVDTKIPLPAAAYRLDDNFIVLQTFNTTARRSSDDDTQYTIAEKESISPLGQISQVRIVSHSESQNWVIFSEIYFKLKG